MRLASAAPSRQLHPATVAARGGTGASPPERSRWRKPRTAGNDHAQRSRRVRSLANRLRSVPPRLHELARTTQQRTEAAIRPANTGRCSSAAHPRRPGGVFRGDTGRGFRRGCASDRRLPSDEALRLRVSSCQGVAALGRDSMGAAQTKMYWCGRLLTHASPVEGSDHA